MNNTAIKNRGTSKLICKETPQVKSQDSSTIIEILPGGALILTGIIAVIVGVLLKKNKKK